MASSSSSPTGSWKYDVFLSFRGEDTRKTFVDHLYYALGQHGIHTYKDDVSLDRGDSIGPSLLKAIETSKILVVIFSENYADSSWCLDELSHIMKCKEEDSETGQIVMPIFYHVDPSDVRKQKRKYGEAFAKHEQSENNKSKVESWRKALIDASNIAGWEPKHVANGHEARCIQEIVGSILDKLSSLDSTVEDENLVGMRTRLQQLRSHLRIGSGGVRMVGIWGLGGGGKTTLATSLYKKFSPNFHGCCFLGDIRDKTKQHGLQSLQEKILLTVLHKHIPVETVELGKDKIKQMLCLRKVLIVLDDVDHLDQLKALAGCHKWFGDGSCIIITTRDQHLLTTHRVDEVYPISLLSREEAVRLFNKHAYNKNKPVEGYEMLSQQIISYADGLPLALIVLGSFLYDKDKAEWLSTLARVKDHPEMDIVEKLKISYDGLKPVEKELFLDIACFFRRTRDDEIQGKLGFPAQGASKKHSKRKMRMKKGLPYRGTKENEPMQILEACGFYPQIGVKVLIQKALITISLLGTFDMHDLVQEMAHYIVRGEHPNNPEKFSRVWRNEDFEDICSRNEIMENDKIEAIHPDVRPPNFIMFVSNMKKLRFLKVNTTFDEGPSFLSNELRYLRWSHYPASPFPESFQPRKLVVLKLERSLQKELWKSFKYLPCLKEMELFYMEALTRTPDFSGLPCLEKLILDGCESLEEIHQSLGNHSSLVSVAVRECKKLTRFPTIVKMDKLYTLKISYCKALVRTPDFGGVPCLQKLILEGCESLEEIHLSLGNRSSLVCLRVRQCKKLTRFPSINRMEKLEILEFCCCGAVVEFPKIKAKMDRLIELSLIGVDKEIVHSSVGNYCTNLTSLWLTGCGLKDGEIPNEVGQLFNLRELYLYGNPFTGLDFSLLSLTRLKLLNLSNCVNLVELPRLPSSLAILEANWCLSLNTIFRDDDHINCKCLCHVSIIGGRKNPIGAERLIAAMFQGDSVETGCGYVRLAGVEILRMFEPRLVRGRGCRMQLPKNWYNDFSGFLFFTASTRDGYQDIIMKHEKLAYVYMEKSVVVDSLDTDDKNGVDKYGSKHAWVGYVSFGLLRNTLWWDQTSPAIEIEFDPLSYVTIHGCGCKLVPKRSETSITNSFPSFDDVSNDYSCKLYDLRDSKSTLTYAIQSYEWGRS